MTDAFVIGKIFALDGERYTITCIVSKNNLNTFLAFAPETYVYVYRCKGLHF